MLHHINFSIGLFISVHYSTFYCYDRVVYQENSDTMPQNCFGYYHRLSVSVDSGGDNQPHDVANLNTAAMCTNVYITRTRY